MMLNYIFIMSTTNLLLLGHTHSSSSTTSGFGVLTSHTQAEIRYRMT